MEISLAIQEMALGDACEDADLIEQAMVHYRKALEMDPGNPQIMSTLADMLIEHDQGLEEGMEIVSQALQIETSSFWLPDYLLYLWGLGHYKMGNYEKAFEAIKTVDTNISGYTIKYNQALSEIELAMEKNQTASRRDD